MADVVPNESLVNLMKLAVQSEHALKVRLFKNDHVPGPDTELADLTEATFSGYAALTLDPMSEPATMPGGKVRSQSLPVVFEHDGGPVANDVYGYMVTLELPGGSAMLWCGRYEDAPVLMSGVGDVIDFTAEIRETQEV